MSDASEAVIARIQKLMALATNNPNEAEAASAAAKVQGMLEAYGLSLHEIDQATGQKASADRMDKKRRGGLYKWQRGLWKAVAHLHFCHFWESKGLEKGSSYEMRMLGRDVNVISAELLAGYLQDTIERMARERVNHEGRYFFTKDSIAFREGIADRLVERLNTRRWEQEREAQRQRDEEEKRRQQPGYAATANALTILDLKLSEKELNDDYLHGEGYSARRRQEEQDRQARMAKVRADQAEWERNNPEEAAQRKAAQEKQDKEWQRRWERNARRRTGGGYRREEEKPFSYYEGRGRGDGISLDQQIDRAHRPSIK